MSIQKAKDEADQRAYDVRQRIDQVTQALNAAIERKQGKPCMVCGAHAARTRPYAVIPASFIATSLVLNDLDAHFALLSLRCVWLCVDHPRHFRNLFIDAGDNNVDLDRLERRAMTLQAFVSGQLVVFGGPAAIKVVEEFYAELTCVKQEVERLGETATSLLHRSKLERQGYDLARAAVHNEHVLPDPKFPDTPGLYGGFSFSNRKSGQLWKLDLWGWAGAWFEQRHIHHIELYQQLKRADRDLILRLKEAEGYGRAFVSVDVYEFALAGEGASLEDFERFLRERDA